MSKRDQYYTTRSSYADLKQWQSLIKDKQTAAAVHYWKAKNLHNGPDCYVQYKTDSWISPLYYCCLNPDAGDMVKLLLRTGAEVDQKPDSDTMELLPFACHSLYLRTIALKHKGGSYQRNELVDRSILRRLNSGDAKRLIHLMNLGLLDDDVIISYIKDKDDIIMDKLQAMIKYLTFCYNIRAQAGDLNLTEETNKTLIKYQQVILFLIKYGAVVTPETITLCINHYLYEIIQSIYLYYPGKIQEPIYHTQMDSTKVAIMRPLLNDYRYVKTCSVTGHRPDQEVFNYDINS